MFAMLISRLPQCTDVQSPVSVYTVPSVTWHWDVKVMEA